jgi:hypothetical protein
MNIWIWNSSMLLLKTQYFLRSSLIHLFIIEAVFVYGLCNDAVKWSDSMWIVSNDRMISE